jgi:nitroimidazol reductase NimA-like FMN-containing flavoprotein (pyridoxamine 5'-phosphate oxidase superfamily)
MSVNLPGKYDWDTISAIIDQAPILHVSFPPQSSDTGEDADYPVILPMLGCTGSFPARKASDSSATHSVYLHGYVSSRMFRLSKDGAPGEPVQGGLKITVAATLLDGLVLALTPNHHSCNYRSAVVFGRAHLVTDEAERLYAMTLVMDNLIPERWEDTRYPTGAELKATGIIRVDIETGSAKIRTGTTGEDRRDLQDEELKRRVWAGVIPMWTHYGRPVPAPTNRTKETPLYITDRFTKWNQDSEKYAYDVAENTS